MAPKQVKKVKKEARDEAREHHRRMVARFFKMLEVYRPDGFVVTIAWD